MYKFVSKIQAATNQSSAATLNMRGFCWPAIQSKVSMRQTSTQSFIKIHEGIQKLLSGNHRTDGQTDRPTDLLTDGPSNRRTLPHIELLGRS